MINYWGKTCKLTFWSEPRSEGTITAIISLLWSEPRSEGTGTAIISLLWSPNRSYVNFSSRSLLRLQFWCLTLPGNRRFPMLIHSIRLLRHIVLCVTAHRHQQTYCPLCYNSQTSRRIVLCVTARRDQQTCCPLCYSILKPADALQLSRLV